MTGAERLRARSLIAKHLDRLNEIEREAAAIGAPWVLAFPDSYVGRMRFLLAVARWISVACEITPGLRPESFVEDVKAAAAIWVELGEPLRDPGRVQ